MRVVLGQRFAYMYKSESIFFGVWQQETPLSHTHDYVAIMVPFIDGILLVDTIFTNYCYKIEFFYNFFTLYEYIYSYSYVQTSKNQNGNSFDL